MTQHTDELAYIATIQGIAAPDGDPMKFCYPAVPDYAAADSGYCAGLAQAPSGVSGEWNPAAAKITSGRWHLAFRPDLGPLDWFLVSPSPPTEIGVAINSTAVQITFRHLRQDTPISEGDTVFCGRESIRIVTWPAASKTATAVTRGVAGSVAEAHAAGADVYTQPQTLDGRRVVMYEVPLVGSAAINESQIVAGYVSSDPSWEIHYPQIDLIDRPRGDLNIEPNAVYPGLIAYRDGADGQRQLDYVTVFNSPPIGKPTATGGYFLFPNGSVYKGVYTEATGLWVIDMGCPMWGSPWDPLAANEDCKLYVVALSDMYREYPAFGRTARPAGPWENSDNPVTIGLNMLLSTQAADNYDGADSYSYDLGPYRSSSGTKIGLYPYYSLGVPRALVDLPTFEAALNGPLNGIRADRFWIGGRQIEPVHDALRRLLAPWGYAAGTGLNGVWTLQRIRDVYPEASTITIESSDILARRPIRQWAQGRILDRVTLELDPGPDGKSTSTYVGREVDEGPAYLPGFGSGETISPCPYTIGRFTRTVSREALLIANRVRRLSRRLCWVEVSVRPRLFGQIEIGSAVRLTHPALVDPKTGIRLAAGQYVQGLVTSIGVGSLRERVMDLRIMLDSSPPTRLLSPCAQVVSYAYPRITVTQQNYSHGSQYDARTFAIGAPIILCTSRLAAESPVAQNPPVRVSAVGDNWIDIDRAFSAGTVSAGDVVTYRDYDCVGQYASAELLKYGFMADGPDAKKPGLGASNAAPHEYGD